MRTNFKNVKGIGTMKKVIFGSALFIGGILLLGIFQMPNLTTPLGELVRLGGFVWFFTNILIFALIITGLILGIKGLKENE